MPAKLLRATDPIVVKQIGVVLYGQPGSRKTSLAQTANKPFTFAFDPGIYRAHGRKDSVTFERWEEVVILCRDSRLAKLNQCPASPWQETSNADYADLAYRVGTAETLNVDTLGMGMESLSKTLIEENPKNGNKQGGLSLPGYGALASRFGAWVSSIHNNGQDVVMIAHEETTRQGDEEYHMPSVLGKKFYSTLMYYADMVGYLFFDQGKRVIDFTPHDRFMAKVPPCGFKRVVLEDAMPGNFLGQIIGQAKASMGQISQASAKVAEEVQMWIDWIAKTPDLATMNNGLMDLASLSGQVKVTAWDLCKAYAGKQGWVFDKAAKGYVLPVPAEEGAA